MRPRALFRIIVGLCTAAALITALIFAVQSPHEEQIYRSFRAITYAIMALTFATLYRYFED
jgi:hypothetical protein